MSIENTEIVHPGKVVKDFINSLRLTADEAAMRLNVTKSTYLRLINGTHNISKKMAKGLSGLGGMNSTEEKTQDQKTRDYDYWIKLRDDYKSAIRGKKLEDKKDV